MLESPKHICDVCDKHFVSKSNLMYHKAEAHVKEKIKCEICSKTYVLNHISPDNWCWKINISKTASIAFRLVNEAQKIKHMRNAHGNSRSIEQIMLKIKMSKKIIILIILHTETMSQQTLDYVVAHFDMSCDQCDVMFESFPHAKRHYLSEHSEPKGYLKCCSKKMRSLGKSAYLHYLLVRRSSQILLNMVLLSFLMNFFFILTPFYHFYHINGIIHLASIHLFALHDLIISCHWRAHKLA